MKPATAATLAQGDLEVVAGRRAGWAVLSTNRVFTAGTRTTTLFGGITDQHWVGKVEAFRCKNRDSGGLVGRNVYLCKHYEKSIIHHLMCCHG